MARDIAHVGCDGDSAHSQHLCSDDPANDRGTRWNTAHPRLARYYNYHGHSVSAKLIRIRLGHICIWRKRVEGSGGGVVYWDVDRHINPKRYVHLIIKRN